MRTGAAFSTSVNPSAVLGVPTGPRAQVQGAPIDAPLACSTPGLRALRIRQCQQRARASGGDHCSRDWSLGRSGPTMGKALMHLALRLQPSVRVHAVWPRDPLRCAQCTWRPLPCSMKGVSGVCLPTCLALTCLDFPLSNNSVILDKLSALRVGSQALVTFWVKSSRKRRALDDLW